MKVDFNSTTQDGGPHNQEGWWGYSAGHEIASDFVAVDYNGITVAPAWPNTADNRVQQSIDRGSGNDATWNDSLGYLNLVTDWIGIDTRIENGGNGNWDGVAGTPTYMDLAIGGLAAGGYDWISFHHDTENVYGPFAVWISTDGGTTYTRLADGLMTDGTAGGSPDSGATESGPDIYLLPSTYRTSFTANGADDVILRFAPYSGGAVHRQIWGMNAFSLESTDPCLNTPPLVQGPDTLVVNPLDAIFIDVTVTDDGKPYREGCNPEHPDAGTSFPTHYLWTQQSGPAPVTFEPIEANVEDPTIVFPLAGTYELLLQVSDGPAGEKPEDGKTCDFLIIVEAIRPLAGDIDRNGIVDIQDLRIFAGQWLAMPPCLDGSDCADLDDNGKVTADDLDLMASNWLLETSRVVIHEFVASNSQSLTDGDGNASDWIEIYNPDDQSISLNGWYLTDDKENLQKWPFPPQAIVPAGGYLVVFASDQSIDDYVDAGGFFHANFAIDKEGEYLALIGPGGRIVHEYAPVFPPQETDISYGMWGSLFRYFAVPTPGRKNQQEFLGFTEKTSHNYEHGFYDQPFDLRITCKTPDTTIRYTLDGSEPTEQHGFLYDPEHPILVATTRLVRSVAITPGYRPGDVSTHTYLFVDDVAQQPADPPGWPSDWGYSSDAGSVVPSDYQMDSRVVNNTQPGYSIRDALLDIPTVSISMEPDEFISSASGIYANPISRWERKCSVEYILPDRTDGFQHDCKIEIHGNASRRPYRMQKHSLRLTFTSLYGPAKLRYPLFPGSDVEEFNQLVLRASFTDSWGLVSWSSSRYRPNDSQYIRDVWMKESLREMGQPSSYGRFVHVYVNGLYFGLYNLSERLAEDFFADHLGGEPEDWQINEDFSSPGARWRDMMSIDPSTLAGYIQIQDYLDVENLADYMLLHFYADAEDWPHHNGYAAVNAVSHDGKFRFFVWDQEIVLDYHGRMASRIDSTGGVGDVFQKMRASEEFRLLFADRVYKHCFNGGALSRTGSQERYARIAGQIDKAIVAESARWGDTQMTTPYGNSIEQPNPLTDINHDLYPPAPHGPDYYFTREDSWIIERDNVIQNYIPAIHDIANSFALLNVFRARNLYPSIDPPGLFVDGAYQHGGYASTGKVLTLANPNGTGKIYYTSDGNDPRRASIAQPGFIKVIVPENAAKRIFVPFQDMGLTWTGGNEPYDDTAWTRGVFIPDKAGGVGYELESGYDSWISYDMESDMVGKNVTSAYMRIPFTLTSDDLTDRNILTLNMRYDDGFVAYLNGQEVIQSPTVTDPHHWNARAGAHESGGQEAFDISDWIGTLQAGENILAIHGINASDTSTDFLVSAELAIGRENFQTSLSESAVEYQNPISLTHSVCIQSRVLSNSGQWSALNEAVFAVGPVKESLRITELMYHPADPNDEFIELLNVGAESINLNRVRFTKGLTLAFTPLDVAPGQYIVLVSNEARFRQLHPNFAGTVAAVYPGNLNNAGERIKLLDALGAPIQDFTFQDSWYPMTDGEGFSLTIRDPYSSDPNQWDSKAGWRPSALVGGSPG
ncbi:MAG: lamin tail domain-containing protein, partial [Sedimentisphaerales bacterium]|nr:lamin tail domain-containing protein [Sedimentisphaerales bacterium]